MYVCVGKFVFVPLCVVGELWLEFPEELAVAELSAFGYLFVCFHFADPMHSALEW